MMKKKEYKQTSLRLSTDAKNLIELISQKLGVTQSAVIELSIRRFADAELAVKGLADAGQEGAK